MRSFTGSIAYLAECVRNLGIVTGYRYFRLESRARQDPTLVPRWCDEMEAAAKEDEDAGHMGSAEDLRLFSTRCRQEHARFFPDYQKTPRRIVCAAIRKNGYIITGVRHYDRLMRDHIRRAGGRVRRLRCEQGFVDQFGQFLGREEAWSIAEEQGQIRRDLGTSGTLYSEHLY